MGNCLVAGYRRIVDSRHERKKQGDAEKINTGIEACQRQVQTLEHDASTIQQRIADVRTTIKCKLRQHDKEGALRAIKTMKMHQAHDHATQEKIGALASLRIKLETAWQTRNMQEAFVDFVDTTKRVTDNGKLVQNIGEQVGEVEEQNQTLHDLEETMEELFKSTGNLDLAINDYDLEDELNQWIRAEEEEEAAEEGETNVRRSPTNDHVRATAPTTRNHEVAAESFDPSVLLTTTEPRVRASELEREPLLN